MPNERPSVWSEILAAAFWATLAFTSWIALLLAVAE